ncbi:MAG: 50S ribosomal protein L10 [Thermoplasmata archaeon]|nr:50S ribosomal protein L10 [Thermoplasmata archaeon]
MDREPATWKQDYVADLKKVIEASPVIGIVNVTGIPAPQLQKMRASLRGKMTLLVAKNNLLLLALNELDKDKAGVAGLIDLIDGQCAIVGSTDNPFKLYKVMEATKTASPAKGGELAPDDIDIKAGETPFKPGPIVGDLQQAGIPAAIEGGKVVIKKSKTLVKAGEPIPVNMAQMLTKLEIFPMTVGMDLRGVFEEGLVFKSDVLAIDEEQFMGDLMGTISGAFSLACQIGYTTPLTIRPLLTKGSSEAMNVAIFAEITNKDTIEKLLGMAGGKMMALASQVPDALDDELKEKMGAASAAAAVAAPVSKPDDDKKKDEPEDEEEEVSEEDAAAGLGALFG